MMRTWRTSINNNRKKIVLVGPAYPYRGGNSLFVSYVYEKLAPKFDVKLYNYKVLYPSLLFPGTSQFDNSKVPMKKAPNERVVNSVNPFNWIKTAHKIIKENADLVVFDWWHPFFAPCHFTISFLIKKHYRGKILFITDNYVSHEGNFSDKLLTKVGLSNASAFIALSDQVEQELIDGGFDQKVYKSELPIYDCYNENLPSTAEAKTRLGFDKDDKVILFFGYVRKYKGLDLLIDAFEELSKEMKDLRLLIVGEFYDAPAPYIDLIKKYGIENKVKLVNKFVPNEDVGEYYAATDLNVLPYRTATQSGILNVSYGFRKPAVVTDVGGLAESVLEGQTGFMVKPDSKEALIEGIKKFFTLRDVIDFENNIKDFVGLNKFEKLPELFEEIIADSNK